MMPPSGSGSFVHTLACATLMTLITIASYAAETSVAIYDHDPTHLWNRLYEAIATRTEDGIKYGVDNSEPYGLSVDDPAKLITILDEFIESNGQDRVSDGLKRALLLNDIWAAFDFAASPNGNREGAPLQRRLARIIGRLRLDDAAISALPDNYAEAVKSATFASDFDPGHPENPFLPPDLFDPNGPWVQIRDGRGELAAPVHVQRLSGRSAFLVFIRCPGGREATLSYLKTLNLYPTPWVFKPAEIATIYPSHEQVRWDPLRLDPSTPQFPEGTIVALVRQMMVINEKLEPVPTSITEKVQFRVYKKIGGTWSGDPRTNFNARQVAYEFVMRRRELLAGKPGGLLPVGPDEAEHQLITRMIGLPRAKELQGPVVLSTCVTCHSGDGIFSVHSYRRSFTMTTNPQLLPSNDLDYERAEAGRWKMKQFNWGLLRGLLAVEAPTPSSR